MEYVGNDLFWERPGRPLTEQEMRCYRLWFDFLKMSERKKWSESVASDFGDLNCEFDEWWPKHSFLFHHLKPFTINEINSEEDFQNYTDNGPTKREGDIVVLAVNLGESNSVLQTAFTEILLKYQIKGKAGRPPYNDELAYVRSFAARPDPDMLEKILAVYRVYETEQQKPKKERLTSSQIEETVSKSAPLIIKTTEKADYLWSMPAKEVTPDVIKRREKSQHTTVMRYVKYAEEILENVIVGKFPVYTVSNTKD